MRRFHNDLIAIGFKTVGSIFLEYPRKLLIGSTPPNGITDIYLYEKDDKNFVVIYPKHNSKWKVKWFGDVKDKLKEVKDIEGR